MSIQQFTVQPTHSTSLDVIFIIMVALGVFLIISWFSSRIFDFLSSISFPPRRGNRYVNLVFGVVIIVLGVGLFFVVYAPSTVTVGSGYIQVDSNMFSPVPIFNMEIKVSANEISSAFIDRVDSGEFALGNKQWGTSFGETHLGVFTLGNGAIADVLSTNSTSLIIQLTSGKYVIVGTENTKALADVFAENVHPIQAPTG